MPDGFPTVGQFAAEVRSKNAGPFWLTLDIFLHTDADYQALAVAGAITPERIGRLYHVDPGQVRVFHMPHIRVVKISFPRPVPAGSFEDRDQHAGQQYLPLALMPLHPADEPVPVPTA